MYVIEVIPLAKLPPQVPQLLSYFFDRPLPRGALVQAPLGSRPVKAVVVSSASLDEQKVSVKKSSFQLKKLTAVLDESSSVGKAQLSLALWLSRFYFAPLGACLKTVLPPFFGKKKYRLAWPEIPTAVADVPKPLVILSRAKDAAANIKPLIKEELRSGRQVALITPELETVRYFAGEFTKHDPVLVHSALSNAEYFRNSGRIASGASCLVIGTRAALFSPFSKLSLVIIDDPLNEAYKSDMSPRLNTADLAHKTANLYGARVVYVTPCLNAEAYHWISRAENELLDAGKKEPLEPVVADMARELRTGNFSIFSRSLQAELLSALGKKQRILLYSARRAYSSMLICRNCGTLSLCANCSIPMRVHRAALSGAQTESLLVCYRCSAYRSAPDRCPNCQSSALKATGFAGSQKIKEQFEQLLAAHGVKGADTFILDSDLIRSPAQEHQLLDQAARSPLPVIVATSMIFSHRYEMSFDLIGIVNADALLSSADFRTDERFIYQFERLKDLAPGRMIIQTFNPEQRVLQALGAEARTGFFGTELATRKALAYPPFSRLIKLSFRHPDRTKAFQSARILAERLKMAAARLGLGNEVSVLGPSPALVAKEKNEYAYNLVLKMLAGAGHADAMLKYIPSQWTVDVDPKSVV